MSSVGFLGYRLCSRVQEVYRTGFWNAPRRVRETGVGRREKNVVQLQWASADPTGNSRAGMASQSCIGWEVNLCTCRDQAEGLCTCIFVEISRKCQRKKFSSVLENSYTPEKPAELGGRAWGKIWRAYYSSPLTCGKWKRIFICGFRGQIDQRNK